MCIFAAIMKRFARYNYLILVYLSGIVFFTLFRIAETVAYCAQTAGPDDFEGMYLHALWNGFRFDTTVSTYLLALPMLLLIVGELGRIGKRWYYTIIHYLTMVLYTVAFFGCAADIPYFTGFFTHIDAAALDWVEADTFGTLAGSILGEPVYLLYLAIYIAMMVGWWLIGRLLLRRLLLPNLAQRLPIGWAITAWVLLLGVGFIGMRGRLSGKSPIRISTAYFCSNPFLNQIGVNPIFNFIKSIEDAGKSANKPIHLTEEEEAAAVWSEQRGWNTTVDGWPEGSPKGMNVVMVLMESMSADKTSLGSEATSMTPCLDSLMRLSHTFAEAYSAGIHTYNGIYSTLYSQPAILARQIMKNSPMPIVCGLPQTMAAAGYSTTFFAAYDANYDNMRGFLYSNGFEKVVDQSCYPSEEIKSTWGVPDHVLLRHVVEHCDSAYSKGPFFACCLTCSDHTPFYLPEDVDLVHQRTELADKMVEYADWSIGQFMQMAATRPWFDNTLFVFVADHGTFHTPVYDMALSHNQVPLLFFAPKWITPHRDERLASQIDIAPTLLNMLGMAVPESMLGVDLGHTTRPYVYFSADDKIGCVDGELFYLYRAKADKGSLYRYKEQSTEDLIESMPGKADTLRRYAFGMTQTSQRLLAEGRTACGL